MTRKLYIYLILSIGLMSFSISGGPMISAKSSKKIDKMLSKIWKESDSRVSLSLVKDSVSSHQLTYEVKDSSELVGYMSYRTANGCVSGGCSTENVACSKSEVSYETFDYVMVTDVNGSIKEVKVLEYRSDYGYEIMSKSWLKQFIGYNGGELRYGKDIDAISGATISANSIIDDVQVAHSVLSKYTLKEIVDK